MNEDNEKPLDTSLGMISDLAVAAPPPALTESEFHLVRKGDYYDLRHKIPSLRQIGVRVGWTQKVFDEKKLDADLSCFLLDKNGQTRVDEDFVFYNNEIGCDGAVQYKGDSRTGAGEGDDEFLSIDLNGVPFDIVRIVLTLTVYNGHESGQDLGMARNVFMRFVNEDDDDEIVRIQLDDEAMEGIIGMRVASLVREGPKWFLEVLEEPVKSLGTLAAEYGLLIGAGD